MRAAAGDRYYLKRRFPRGPDLYPIYYEATIVGSCTLKDRDFAVKIVVKELPTVQP